MAVGYALIRTRPHYEIKVHDALNKISEVTEVHPLFGEYDFIAKVQTNEFSAITGQIIAEKIRSIEGIVETLYLG